MSIAMKILRESKTNCRSMTLFIALSVCAYLMLIQRREVPPVIMDDITNMRPNIGMSSLIQQQTLETSDPTVIPKAQNDVLILVWTPLFGAGSKYAR